jgi:hypothetical protein
MACSGTSLAFIRSYIAQSMPLYQNAQELVRCQPYNKLLLFDPTLPDVMVERLTPLLRIREVPVQISARTPAISA